ncbi:hypothetical protein F7725_016645 [Dissostichus mawsoni]|uniref:Musculoskeletal embryonic nuclear protein 1 n=1 Tax=Dissostichus mawsoni TaxID=36200 RepID=A0A7J5Z271_DISMA|nr:hypothetical protein F7725_016645 [Dissostichus mawsoni]
MSQPGEVKRKKRPPMKEEDLKGARSKLGLKGESRVRPMRAYGQNGSVGVQWSEDGDGDGPGEACCCQSSWSQCVQQVDKSTEENTLYVLMVMMIF